MPTDINLPVLPGFCMYSELSATLVIYVLTSSVTWGRRDLSGDQALETEYHRGGRCSKRKLNGEEVHAQSYLAYVAFTF
jgi:hypothetical protein